MAATHVTAAFRCMRYTRVIAAKYAVIVRVLLTQGSVMTNQLSHESLEATEDARRFLKSRLRLAWSGEAVKQ